MSILSKNQKLNLRAMQTKGNIPEEIAKKLEIDELTVLEELEELHLKPNVKDVVLPSEFATHQTIPQKTTALRSKTWTPEVVDKQLSDLDKCIDDCLSYTQMSDLIGKSAKAIRGKIACIYGTEVLDKVRAIKNTPQATANSLESKRK